MLLEGAKRGTRGKKHWRLTSIVKNVREKSKSVEKVLKLSHIPWWYVDVVTTEKTACMFGTSSRNKLMY